MITTENVIWAIAAAAATYIVTDKDAREYVVQGVAKAAGYTSETLAGWAKTLAEKAEEAPKA